MMTRAGQANGIVLAAIIIPVLSLLCWGSTTKAAAEWLHSLVNTPLPESQPDLTGDPRVGSSINLGATTTDGSPLKLRGKNLIIYMGSCQSCSTQRFDEHLVQGDFDQVILVFDGNVTEVDMIPERNDVVAIGADNALLNQLNCIWLPRYYLIGTDGKLLDLQRDRLTLPVFVADGGFKKQ